MINITDNLLTEVSNALAGHSDINISFAFGSVLNDKYFRKDSDIDIGIMGTKLFDSDFLLSLNLELSERLHREIDLVDLNKVSGVILSQILTKGRLLFNKRPDLYCRIIKKMWYNQSDMMPYYRMILKARRNRMIVRVK